MTKIFLTGASGYIGGDLLHLITQLHPEYQVRALVRDAGKIETINKSSTTVTAVEGSLDDNEIIEREAGEADLVLNLASSSHLKSVQSIHRGLLGTSKSYGRKPYWIQMSGGAAVVSAELADTHWEPGRASDITWDDLGGIDLIKTIIKNDSSRAVDNYMLLVAQSTQVIKTAVVYPPIIYGVGRGLVNQRSVQIPDLAKETLKRRRAFKLGNGLNRWGNIHIRDLSEMLLRLIEKAVEGSQNRNLWGSNGIYLTGVGELAFADISRRIAAAAFDLQLLSDTSIEVMKEDEFNQLLKHEGFNGTVLYGTNSRGGPNRAQKYLDWSPTHHSLEEEIVETVAREAVTLGLMKTESLLYST